MAPTGSIAVDVADPSGRSAVNPYVNKSSPPTPYNLFQLVVPGLVLLPVRVVLTAVILIFTWLFATLSIAGLSEENRQKPLVAWRRGLLRVAQVFIRLHLLVFGVWWIRTSGSYPGRGTAPVLVANHTTWLDGFVIAWLQWGHPVSRIENLRIPVLGYLFHAAQCIFVDRRDPASRKKVMEAMQQRAREDGWHSPLIVFPEGTCVNQEALISFRPGAFAVSVPVQPVAIKYGCKRFDVSWVYGTSPLTWVVMLTQWSIPVSVDFLDVMYPVEGEGAMRFGERVRGSMQAALGCAVTQHNHLDLKLQQTAVRLRPPLPPKDCAVEMGLLDVPYEAVERLLYLFHHLRDGSRTVDLRNLPIALPPSSILSLLPNSPYTFADFVWGCLAVTARHPSPTDRSHPVVDQLYALETPPPPPRKASAKVAPALEQPSSPDAPSPTSPPPDDLALHIFPAVLLIALQQRGPPESPPPD
eukprot:Sspe_Gene.33140::Locus_16209_Transcript_1_1_Confidence_1.000_Length_1528::g.33140::m.33140